MNRDEALERLRTRRTPWDIVVVGGGATGLGVALDAATRGYHVLLLERGDFAQGTSSRSTKLLHGGVRYLRQGNVRLVRSALAERGRVLANAPHLAQPLPFVIPTRHLGERLFYGMGLAVYERLSGSASLGRSRMLDRTATLRALPGLRAEGVDGGVRYFDAQFDDARLAVCLAATAWEQGATLVNRVEARGLLRASPTGPVCGVAVREAETGEELEVPARVVVNACGVFCDDIRQLADPTAQRWIAPSQGTHLVLDAACMPGQAAMMIPRTDDGRVLFLIPWQGRVLLGTTDIAVTQPEAEPCAQAGEIDYLLDHASRHLETPPRRDQVRAVFSGLRPLVSAPGASGGPATLARDHFLNSENGLVSITGGKWTTYREMAEHTVDLAARLAGLPGRPCRTASLPLHGASRVVDGPLRGYGSDALALTELVHEHPEWAECVHPGLSLTAAQVVWAARHEMARRVEDVLARRTRALLLDARASIEAAPAVARLLATELGKDARWEAREISDYVRLAGMHCLPQGRHDQQQDDPPPA